MKTSLYFLSLSALFCLSSCESEVTDLASANLFPKIELSETPVWIHEDCPEKTLFIKIDTRLKGELSTTVDGEALTPVLVDSVFDQYYLVEIPTEKRYKTLTVQVVGTADKLQVPIHYHGNGATLAYYSANIATEPRPIALFNRECWPDYSGNPIKGGNEYMISSTLHREDRIIGDSLQRQLKFKNVILEDMITNEQFPIAPELTHTFTVKNHFNIAPSNSSEDSHLINSFTRIMDTSNKNNVRYGISPTKDALPSYLIIGHELGKHFTIKVKGCYDYDTLSAEPIRLPAWYQFELECPVNYTTNH